MILIRTDHPYLRVGRHTGPVTALASPQGRTAEDGLRSKRPGPSAHVASLARNSFGGGGGGG
jgi:hypothetical protein